MRTQESLAHPGGSGGYWVSRNAMPWPDVWVTLFLHDSRETPETAVLLLHQKRLGSGSEPTKEKIKLLSQVKIKHR